MNDKKFMELALKLAKKGNPLPNPYVGAVLVKNGKVISTGYHKKAGTPHAEVIAIKNAKNPKGATLYLNLEPCNHHGRTPPCTDAIIKAGIKKVVFAMPEINKIAKGGAEKLKRAGVKFISGVMRKEAEELNRVFIKNIRKKMPWVLLKAGLSLDGKIALKNGESKWITSPYARKVARSLRDKYGAVMVGINTVLKDNPSLNGEKGEVLKIIADSKLRIPLNANLFKKGRVLIATSEKADKEKMKALKEKAEIVVFGKNRVDLKKLMRFLYKKGICRVMVEGGATLSGVLLKNKLADELALFFAPKILGKGLSAFDGLVLDSLEHAVRVKNCKVKRIGEDFLLSGTLIYKRRRM